MGGWSDILHNQNDRCNISFNAEVKNGVAVPPLLYISWWHSAKLLKHRGTTTLVVVVVVVVVVVEVVVKVNISFI
jgi:hypothetical protein